MTGHTNAIYYVAPLSYGFIASGGQDTTIRIWRLSDGVCIRTLTGHTNAVWSITALPNGHIASGSSDNSIRIWR
jgi:WD40 repeat protein